MKKLFNKKCLIILLLLTKIPYSGMAQCGLQVSRVIPIGEMSKLLSPGMSYEFTIKPSENYQRLKIGFAIGYYSLDALQDTFFSFATHSGGNGTQVVPGYEIWISYYVIPFGLTSEWKVLDKSFTPFIGFDLYFYLTGFEHKEYYPSYIDLYETKYTWAAAALPKAGLSLELGRKWLILAGVGKSLGFQQGGNSQYYWKPFINISYYPR